MFFASSAYTGADRLGAVRRRGWSTAAPLAIAAGCGSSWFVWFGAVGGQGGSSSLVLCRACSLSRLCSVPSGGFVTDIVIGDALAFAVGDDFVIVVSFGVAGDDVPGVDQARNIAQDTKEDVDQ